MDIVEVLRDALAKNVSDIFVISGTPLSIKLNNRLVHINDTRLMPADTEELIKQIYDLTGNRKMDVLLETGDDDFSFSIRNLGRFRCNAYKQRGSLSAVLRVVAFSLPDYHQLSIPQTVIDLHRRNKGLILITGSAGSGKSTTLACIIDKINKNMNKHIITIEDPIEYLHSHDQSIVSQRELLHDTSTYVSALRAALRQSPNVILLGEMRDFETIATAMTAAETGQLVFSTLHTVGAANTIDRIVDTFPPNQQQQIRIQLSMVLQGVISQQLLPTTDGKITPAFEIMIVNNAIRNMIRESKVHQIDNVIYSSGNEGMIAMDSDILRLFKEGRISRDTALLYSSNAEIMSKKLI